MNIAPSFCHREFFSSLHRIRREENNFPSLFSNGYIFCYHGRFCNFLSNIRSKNCFELLDMFFINIESHHKHADKALGHISTYIYHNYMFYCFCRLKGEHNINRIGKSMRKIHTQVFIQHRRVIIYCRI